MEILQEETFKPKITGIPSSIPSNATVDTFKDLKAPVILKGSPVVKVIEEEIADRKNKIAELEKSGKYQNRIDQHKERISELEKSLEGAFSEHWKEILKADGVNFKE